MLTGFSQFTTKMVRINHQTKAFKHPYVTITFWWSYSGLEGGFTEVKDPLSKHIKRFVESGKIGSQIPHRNHQQVPSSQFLQSSCIVKEINEKYIPLASDWFCSFLTTYIVTMLTFKDRSKNRMNPQFRLGPNRVCINIKIRFITSCAGPQNLLHSVM